MRVRVVRFELCPTKDDFHLVPDRDQKKFLVPPTVIAKDEEEAKASGHFDRSTDHFKEMGSIGDIKKGEHSRFTLRCRKKEQELPDVFFVVAEFWTRKWLFKPRLESSFSHMFVKPLPKIVRAAPRVHN